MGFNEQSMPRPRSSLRWRRTALFAIAVWILMTGEAESDVVEGVNDLRGSTSSQELVPPLEGSSTAESQANAAQPKAFRAGFRAGFLARALPATHPAKAAEAEKQKAAAEKADSEKKEEALKLELKGKKVDAQARATAPDAAEKKKKI